MMSTPDGGDVVNRGLLRVLAAVAVVLIPLVWLGSLAGEPALLRANLIRVLGAMVAAGIAWATVRRGRGRAEGREKGRGRTGLPWARCLTAGVVGSIAVTGLSILVPLLGEFGMAGWLASGIAGGAIVVLAGYALTGGRAPSAGGE